MLLIKLQEVIEFWHQLIQPQTPNALRYVARPESLMPAPYIPGLKAQGFTAAF
jgi:hypothetical protein